MGNGSSTWDRFCSQIRLTASGFFQVAAQLGQYTAVAHAYA